MAYLRLASYRVIPPTDAYRTAAETTAILQGSSGAVLEEERPRRRPANEGAPRSGPEHVSLRSERRRTPPRRRRPRSAVPIDRRAQMPRSRASRLRARRLAPLLQRFAPPAFAYGLRVDPEHHRTDPPAWLTREGRAALTPPSEPGQATRRHAAARRSPRDIACSLSAPGRLAKVRAPRGGRRSRGGSVLQDCSYVRSHSLSSSRATPIEGPGRFEDHDEQ
jgi:hypothetical protein